MNFSNEPAFYQWKPAACLQVTGDDALSFLQGQFTNDLHQDVKGGAVYGLWLNQKGKVLADSFVRKISDREAWIVSYFSPAAVIRERLEAYIIADDVVIADVTESMAGLTVFGAAVDPGAGDSRWSFAGRRTRDPHTEIIFPVSAGTGLSAPPAGGVARSAGQMEWKRIAAGIPAVPADIGPADLPNEGGLETEAISYTKGCYLGQEVMARLKTMGQVRRQLIRVRGTGEPPPRATVLYQGERKAGELRSTAREGAEWIGFALVALTQLRRDQGLAVTPGGAPAISVGDTP